MPIRRHRLAGIAWLELLLALAAIALVFQIFPSLWSGTLRGLDIRNWSRTVWFVANCVVVLMLVAIQFGPELYGNWRERRRRTSVERAKAEAARKAKEEREMLQRLKEGMKRRVY